MNGIFTIDRTGGIDAADKREWANEAELYKD